MVQFTPSDNPACGSFLLCPNNSAGWRNNQMLFYATAIVSFGIATISLLLGAVLIPVFGGAELALLYWGLRRVSRDCARQERIVLTPDAVIIQKGHQRLEQEWHFQRYRTQMQISVSPETYRMTPDVAFCCRQEAVHFGQFLGEEERSELITHLRRLVQGYRQLYLQR